MIKKLLLVSGAALGLGISNAHAAYADVDAVVTAINGVTTTATTTFLAAAGIGVAVITIGMVTYVLKKGVKLR